MKDKLVAAGIHLFISLLIAALILILLFVVWFPSPLMSLGAMQGVQLILLVDLAIGPLLTLLVFKKGKPSLVFDLSVVAALQVSALAYGLTAIYGQTPSHLVSTHEGLYVVSRYEVANYIDEHGYQVSEDIGKSPILYEGRIPVYLLPEAEIEYDRGMSHMTFQFNEGLPYHYNIPSYESFDGFQYLLDAGSAQRGVDNSGQECTETTMISGHGTADVCLRLEAERLHLAN